MSVFNTLSKKIKRKQSKKKYEKHKSTLQDSMQAILHDTTPFVITEAYKSSRTNIMFAVSGDKTECKRIIVTSATPGDGKTTTCLNMAITFAQTGARVIVVDCDMRKPRIHKYLGLDKKNGLSNLLSGFITLDKAVNKNVRGTLDCIVSGPIPPNPAELLSSEMMQNLLDELSKQYDYIFLDTPPVTVVTDACSMSKFVSGVVLVVRQNYTHHQGVADAVESLKFADAKILGFIINDSQSVGGAYGGKGNYKYSYKYKYKYQYEYQYGDNKQNED